MGSQPKESKSTAEAAPELTSEQLDQLLDELLGRKPSRAAKDSGTAEGRAVDSGTVGDAATGGSTGDRSAATSKLSGNELIDDQNAQDILPISSTPSPGSSATPSTPQTIATATADKATTQSHNADQSKGRRINDQLPGVLGAGWSEYYSSRQTDQVDDLWLTDIEDNLPVGFEFFDDYEEAVFEEEESRPILIWPIVLTAIAILIIISGGLTLYIRTLQVSVQTALVTQRENAIAQLNESIAFIQEADVVVIALDKNLENQISLETLENLEVLLEQTNIAQQTLDSAMVSAEAAKNSFSDPADQAIAQHAYDAAVYRKQMLSLGVLLAQADIQALQSAVQLDTAWEAILDADSLMRQAASSASAGGTDRYSRALALNQEALVRLDDAKLALDEAARIFPEADFSTLVNYVQAKRESCVLVIASDEALLANDRVLANDLNDQFVAKDAEVVELAMLIPNDPITIITSAYDTKTNEWRTEYRELFTKAADADAYIREWLLNGGGRQLN